MQLKNDHRTGPVIEISAGISFFDCVYTPMVHQFGHSMDDLFEPGLDLECTNGKWHVIWNSLAKKIAEQVEEALQTNNRTNVPTGFS